jgi:AcrR family transcriptional regulator
LTPRASRSPARRSGRRPGSSDTRQAILAAARRQFVAAGFDQASVRSIAAEAGVDPSLVIHYFGSKDGLLGAVMAWPVNLDEIEEQVVAPGLEGIGERLVRFLLAQWEDPSKRHPLTVIMRNAMGHDEAARLLTEFVRRELVGRIVPLMGEATAELRGSLVASTLVGLAMTRYVVRLEPLASAPADVVVAAMAPVIERLLTGDLAEG